MKHTISVLNGVALWDEGWETVRLVACLVCHELDGEGYSPECSGVRNEEKIVIDFRTKKEEENE